MTEQNQPRRDQGPAQNPQDSSPSDGDYGEDYGKAYDAAPQGEPRGPYDDAYAGIYADDGQLPQSGHEGASGGAYGELREGEPKDAYDDAYAFSAEEPLSTEGPGVVPAAGTEAIDQEPPERSGPPLRGLAMILTAVAVVLIIWGAWSLFAGDDDDKDTAAGTSATAPGGDAAPTGAENPGAEASGEATPEETPPGEAPAGDPASGSGVVDRAATRVTVLNNSANDPIAAPTAERLRNSGWSTTGYGNLSGRVEGISEQSRVYYPEGDAAAQAAAEEVGAELGLPVMAGNSDYYDRFGEATVREGGGADSVVVVLTGAVA